MSIQDLINRAEEVRTTNVEDFNTAERIGGLMKDIVIQMDPDAMVQSAEEAAAIATEKAAESLVNANEALAAKEIALANNELLGGIAYNASAPTPGKSGKYSFTTGGSCTWLTGGAATVAVGDEVVVVYTAPSTYTYTKVGRPDIEQVRSQSTSKVPSSKLVDDLFNLGYLYKGIATPTTVPGTPDGNVFYFATTPGLYSNFGGLELKNNDVAILLNNGVEWSKLMIIDGETYATDETIDLKISELIEKIETDEFAEVLIDSDKKILESRNIAGDKKIHTKLHVDDDLTGKTIDELQEFDSVLQENMEYFAEKSENDEYSEVLVDSEKKILESRKIDGTKEIHTDLIVSGELTQKQQIDEFLSVKTDENGKIYQGLKPDGTMFFSKIQSPTLDGIIPVKVNLDDTNKTVSDHTSTTGLTWNACGTSVTHGYVFDGVDLTPNLYANQVALELGLTLHNHGYSGATMCRNNNMPNNSIIEYVCGLNGRTKISDADIWTLEGCPNDIAYFSEIGSINTPKTEVFTFYGALKNMIEEIQGRPNNPRLMLIRWCFTVYDKDHETQSYELAKAMKWASKYYGIPLLDLHECSGLSPVNIYRMTIEDGIHPTAQATNMFKHKIANFIKNNI